MSKDYSWMFALIGVAVAIGLMFRSKKLSSTNPNKLTAEQIINSTAGKGIDTDLGFGDQSVGASITYAIMSTDNAADAVARGNAIQYQQQTGIATQQNSPYAPGYVAVKPIVTVNNPGVAAANQAAGLDANGFPIITPASAADQAVAAQRQSDANATNASLPVDTSPFSRYGTNPWSDNGGSYPRMQNGVYLSGPNQTNVLSLQWEDQHQQARIAASRTGVIW